jgi:hypothetical protein
MQLAVLWNLVKISEVIFIERERHIYSAAIYRYIRGVLRRAFHVIMHIVPHVIFMSSHGRYSNILMSCATFQSP